MVASCCVPGCSNRAFVSTRALGISFHRLPQVNQRKRNQWLKKIGLTESQIDIVNSRVCSAHFKDEDFKHRAQFGSAKFYKSELHPHAVPSVFETKSNKHKKLRSGKTYMAPSDSEIDENSRGSTDEADVQQEMQGIEEELTGKKIILPERNTSLAEGISMVVEEHTKFVEESGKQGTKENAKLAEENAKLAEENAKLVEKLSKHTNLTAENLKLAEENAKLSEENVKLAKKNAILSEKDATLKNLITFDTIKNNDNLVRLFTGFINSTAYSKLYRYLETRSSKCFVPNSPFLENHDDVLSVKNAFLLTLVRLKLGLPASQLALIFGIGVASVNRIFIQWIKFLNHELRDLFSILPADRLKSGDENFLSPTTLTYECLEFTIQTSKRKRHDVIKALVAATKYGSICLVSQVYDGTVPSIRNSVVHWGFLKVIAAQGHELKANGSFEIPDLPAERVPINLPSNGLDKIQRRVKTYRILNGPLPVSLREVRGELITVCAMLCNFKSGIIAHGKWLLYN